MNQPDQPNKFVENLRRDREDQARERSFEPLVNIVTNEIYRESPIIREMLQNAADAGASVVSFHLDERVLQIQHNGNPFDKKDVVAITDIGRSAKTDMERIGRFGVGFKSVFAVTQRPVIHSGEFHFAIENYIVPHLVDSKDVGKKTLISLPLDGPDGAHKRAMGGLRNLSIFDMLFLTGVEEISWESNGEKHGFWREGNLTPCAGGGESGIVTVRRESEEGQEEKKYWMFRRRARIAGRKLYLQFACLMKDGELHGEENPPLYVYFPTSERPGFGFRMQIPYKPTIGRDHVNYGGGKNKALTENAAHFMADLMPILRDEGLLTPCVIGDIFPVDKARAQNREFPLYTAMFDSVREKFLSGEKLLPTADGGYAAADESILGRNGIEALISEYDAAKIWECGKWLAPQMNKLSRPYLESLGIPCVDFSDFLEKIDDDFFPCTSDEWMLRFYKFLADKYPQGWQGTHRPGMLWGAANNVVSRLRRRRFIRLSDDKHVAPFGADGEPQVFLPFGGKSRFNIVNEKFLNDEKCADFFRDILGLRKPTRVDEIRKFIVPRYSGDGLRVSDDDHVKDIRLIHEAMEENPGGTRHALSKYPVIRAFRCDVDSPAFYAVDACYFCNEQLSAWFAGNPEGVFVDEEFYDSHVGDINWRECFSNLGIAHDIRLFHAERIEEHGHGYHVSGVGSFNPNFSIHGVQHALQYMRDGDLEKSKIAWDMAINYLHMLQGGVRRATNRNALYNADSLKLGISAAGSAFKFNEWLLDSEERVSPHDNFSLSKLHSAYKVEENGDKARQLSTFLGMTKVKIERIKDEAERLGHTVVPMDKYEKFREWEKAEARRKQKEGEVPSHPESGGQSGNEKPGQDSSVKWSAVDSASGGQTENAVSLREDGNGSESEHSDSERPARTGEGGDKNRSEKPTGGTGEEGDIPPENGKERDKEGGEKVGGNGTRIGGKDSEESPAHKELKEYVADNPGLLNLPDDAKVDIEFVFGSMDKVDVLFQTEREWVGVEVKSRVSHDDDIRRGLFQCVKYEALMKAELKVLGKVSTVRVFLVLEQELPPNLQKVKDALGIAVKVIRSP